MHQRSVGNDGHGTDNVRSCRRDAWCSSVATTPTHLPGVLDGLGNPTPLSHLPCDPTSRVRLPRMTAAVPSVEATRQGRSASRSGHLGRSDNTGGGCGFEAGTVSEILGATSGTETVVGTEVRFDPDLDSPPRNYHRTTTPDTVTATMTTITTPTTTQTARFVPYGSSAALRTPLQSRVLAESPNGGTESTWTRRDISTPSVVYSRSLDTPADDPFGIYRCCTPHANLWDDEDDANLIVYDEVEAGPSYDNSNVTSTDGVFEQDGDDDSVFSGLMSADATLVGSGWDNGLAETMLEASPSVSDDGYDEDFEESLFYEEENVYSPTMSLGGATAFSPRWSDSSGTLAESEVENVDPHTGNLIESNSHYGHYGHYGVIDRSTGSQGGGEELDDGAPYGAQHEMELREQNEQVLQLGNHGGDISQSRQPLADIFDNDGDEDSTILQTLSLAGSVAPEGGDVDNGDDHDNVHWSPHPLGGVWPTY